MRTVNCVRLLQVGLRFATYEAADESASYVCGFHTSASRVDLTSRLC